MKIILSRKAFDSGAGKVANPILDDGTLIPMPIPDKKSSIRYQDIVVGGENLGVVASDLTRGRTRADHFAHLDPDLEAGAYRRAAGWRPLFGQRGAAQSVLSREGIGPGDLFLFFGWFRRVTRIEGRLRYVPGSPDVHLIWGWLQIGEVVHVDGSPLPDWMGYHPHLAPGSRGSNNTLYVGGDRLVLEGTVIDLPGAGVCGRYDDRRRLTMPGSSRSIWELPAWFAPNDARPALGYHSDAGRWQINGDRVRLTSAARGQEFVLDASSYPEAIPWVAELLSSG